MQNPCFLYQSIILYPVVLSLWHTLNQPCCKPPIVLSPDQRAFIKSLITWALKEIMYCTTAGILDTTVINACAVRNKWQFQEFHIQSSSWERGHFPHKTNINEANAIVLPHHSFHRMPFICCFFGLTYSLKDEYYAWKQHIREIEFKKVLPHTVRVFPSHLYSANSKKKKKGSELWRFHLSQIQILIKSDPFSMDFYIPVLPSLHSLSVFIGSSLGYSHLAMWNIC